MNCVPELAFLILQAHDENSSTWKKVQNYMNEQKNQFILQPLKDQFSNSPALKRGGYTQCNNIKVY